MAASGAAVGEVDESEFQSTCGRGFRESRRQSVGDPVGAAAMKTATGSKQGVKIDYLVLYTDYSS